MTPVIPPGSTSLVVPEALTSLSCPDFDEASALIAYDSQVYLVIIDPISNENYIQNINEYVH